MQFIQAIDIEVLLFIQEHIRTPVLDSIFKCITALGDNLSIWILIIIGLLLYKRTRKLGIYVLIGYLLCVLSVDIMIKNVVARTRPFVTYPALDNLVSTDSFSFPSGHTATAFTIALSVYHIVNKKYGKILFGIAFLIAISRIYLGVHYPTDILGGIFIGVIISSIVYYGYKKQVLDRYIQLVV